MTIPTPHKTGSTVLRALRTPYLALTLIFLLHLSLRLFLIHHTALPKVVDETVYMSIASFICGVHLPFNIIANPGSEWGYPLALCPVIKLHLPFMLEYKLILILNCVYISLTIFPLYLLGREALRMTQTNASILAGLTLSYPAFLLFPEFSMTENAYIPLYAGVIYVAFRFVVQPTLFASVVFAIGAALLAAVHQWGIETAILAELLILWISVTRRIGFIIPVSAIALLNLGLLAIHLINADILQNLYPTSHDDHSALSLLGTIRHPSTILDCLHRGMGHFWVISASTLGLYPLGLVTLALVASGYITPDSVGHKWNGCRDLAIFLLVSQLLLLSSSAIAMTAVAILDFDSPNLFFVGRYLDGQVSVIILVALASIARTIKSDDLRSRLLLTWLLTAAASLVILRGDWEPYWHGAEGEYVNSIAYVSLLRATGSPAQWVFAIQLLILMALLFSSRALSSMARFVPLAFGTIFLTVGCHEALAEYSRKQAWLHAYISEPPGLLVPLLDRIPHGTEIGFELSNRDYFSELYPLAVPTANISWFNSIPNPRQQYVLASNLWRGDQHGYVEIACEVFQDTCLWGKRSPLTSALKTIEQMSYAKARSPSALVGTEVGSRLTAFTRSEGIFYEERHAEDEWRWTDGDGKIFLRGDGSNLPEIIRLGLWLPQEAGLSVRYNETQIINGSFSGFVYKDIRLPASRRREESVVEIRTLHNSEAHDSADRLPIRIQLRTLSFIREIPISQDVIIADSGVYPTEMAGSTPFRWTNGDAHFHMIVPPRQHLLLELACPDQTPHSHLSVRLNNRQYLETTLVPGSWTTTILPSKTDRYVSLEIFSSQFSVHGDPRKFGVQIRRLTFLP